jgi:hypothetical protein
MRPFPLFITAFAALAAASSAAQTPPETTPMRVIGTVGKLDGRNLTVNPREGAPVTIALSADAAVYGVEKRTLADVKPGDFLASGGVRSTDGKIHAVEVRIFPAALRGTGEGQRPWDVKPDGVMTNATVGTVSQSPEGSVIRVTYKGGESEYIVGPEVPAYVPADMGLPVISSCAAARLARSVSNRSAHRWAPLSASISCTLTRTWSPVRRTLPWST